MQRLHLSSYLVVFIFLFSLVNCGQVSHSQNASAPNRGILNGTTVPAKELNTMAPVLELGMGKDGGESSCTATVIEGGLILTAQHCLRQYLKHDTRPELHIRSVSGDKWLTTLTEKDYKVSLPKEESSFTTVVGYFLGYPIEEKHSEPDLAVIIVTNGVLEDLKKLKAASVISETLTVATADSKEPIPALHIAGTGLAPVEGNKEGKATVGLLHTGSANLNKVEDYYYALEYKKDGKFASALPGDSGGPMYNFGAKGEFQIYGVACSIKASEIDPDTKLPNIITSRYTRLDRKPIQEWLKSLREK